MEEEVWKDIPGYEGLYKVNQWGEIYSEFSKRKIKYSMSNAGYKQYVLFKDRKEHIMTAHRAVALAFIPNPDKLPVINHKDENKLNCYVENLEWCTHAYNNTYGSRAPKGTNKKTKKIYCYNSDGTLYDTFASIKDASNRLNIPDEDISAVAKWKECRAGSTHRRSLEGKIFSFVIREQQEVIDYVRYGKLKKRDPRLRVTETAPRCKVCGKPITFGSCYCVECWNKTKITHKPPRDELLRDLLCRNFKQIGRNHGVGENSVRKWCKSYNLPYRTSVLRDTSDDGILSENWEDQKEENLRKKMEAEQQRIRNRKLCNPKRVSMIDPSSGAVLRVFGSIAEANRYMGKDSPHISSVCQGRRKKAYGFKWEFTDDNQSR